MPRVMVSIQQSVKRKKSETFKSSGLQALSFSTLPVYRRDCRENGSLVLTVCRCRTTGACTWSISIAWRTRTNVYPAHLTTSEANENPSAIVEKKNIYIYMWKKIREAVSSCVIRRLHRTRSGRQPERPAKRLTDILSIPLMDSRRGRVYTRTHYKPRQPSSSSSSPALWMTCFSVFSLILFSSLNPDVHTHTHAHARPLSIYTRCVCLCVLYTGCVPRKFDKKLLPPRPGTMPGVWKRSDDRTKSKTRRTSWYVHVILLSVTAMWYQKR